MRIETTKLHTLMQDVLTTKHFSPAQANDIAEVLVYAEVSGKKTQGVVKLLGADPIQNIEPQYSPKIVRETKLSALIDGGRNPGILVSRLATKQAIDKCNDTGLGIVGTNNTYSSTGALGYYADEIAKNDFIGIIMSGSPKGVAPHGSIDPLLGTNPIAFGFPTEHDPIIFDMATSAITWYELVRASILGQELPLGVAIDHDGNPTKDPQQAMKGAIHTFDNGHKGSGLSMMIELLTGALMGQVARDEETKKWYCGNLFISIDPDLFIGKEAFKKNSSLLIDTVKQSRTVSGSSGVKIPGERSMSAQKQAAQSGEIEIEEQLLANLANVIKQ